MHVEAKTVNFIEVEDRPVLTRGPGMVRKRGKTRRPASIGGIKSTFYSTVG
jgi:hypothetical protein